MSTVVRRRGGPTGTLQVHEAVRPEGLYDRLPRCYHEGVPTAAAEVPGGPLLAAGPAGEMLGGGSSGVTVAALQRALALSRHDPGPSDGSFGPRTESAVRAFQRQRGLVVDGRVGPQTIGELAAPLLRRFLGGLDEVMAPIHSALDNVAGYVAVDTAPEPFLAWLGWLVGAPDLPEATPARRRDAVRRASALHRRRGTVAGMAEAVAVATGVPVGSVRVIEAGETAWDPDPLAELAGRLERRVVVTVHADATAAPGIDVDRLTESLRRDLPLGFDLLVEVVADGGG